jgi:hypothetical protein
MAPQNFMIPVVHHDVPLESTDIEVPGAISGETAAFLIVLAGFVVAFLAAF